MTTNLKTNNLPYLFKNHFWLLLVLCCFFFSLFSQDKGFVVPDSLKGKSFEELKKGVLLNTKKIEVSRIYAFSYLTKAKNNNDNLETIHGFHFLSRLFYNTIKTAYLDSIIEMSTNKNYKSYPMKGYLEKGNFYYTKRNFNEALKNYLVGEKFSVLKNNMYLTTIFNHRIGLIKSRIGDYKSALTLFKSCNLFFELSNNKVIYKNDYISTLFALAMSLNENKKYNISSDINKLGYNESINLGLDEFKNYFSLNEGINQYSIGNIKVAQDSLMKTLHFFHKHKDLPNQIINNYYLGEIYKILGYSNKSTTFFIKVDSLFNITKDIHPDARNSYLNLISYYKSNNDIVNQLYYTEKLLKVDSILVSNYKNLNYNIINKFDTPKLINDKEVIINSLNKKSKRYKIYLIILFLLSSVFLFFYIKKIKIYKKRFEKLMSKKNESSLINIKNDLINYNNISIIKAKPILMQLDIFEKENGFLETKLTQTNLAKQLNTNSTYLSKVINQYKNTNFNTYINNLRVDYAIKKLKEDKKLYLLSIDGMSNEFGFNNSETFSKAFYKKTGIYPSYFIKQLKKKEN